MRAKPAAFKVEIPDALIFFMGPDVAMPSCSAPSQVSTLAASCQGCPLPGDCVCGCLLE